MQKNKNIILNISPGNLRRLIGRVVDKIYIKIICIAKVSKYPPKQYIQNRTKSEMVYQGIFDLKAKNAFLIMFFYFSKKSKTKRAKIINVTIFKYFRA